MLAKTGDTPSRKIESKARATIKTKGNLRTQRDVKVCGLLPFVRMEIVF